MDSAIQTPWQKVAVKFGWTQTKLARSLGRHRSKISVALKDPKGLISGVDQEALLRVARENGINLLSSDLLPDSFHSMNIQAPAIKTADDFLRWNEGREGKREFVHGRIVEMMVNVSRNHAKLSTKLASLLLNALDAGLYDIGSADFAVRTAQGIRYPDVFVDRAIGEGSDLAAREPVLLAEILSPTSLARDFGEKVADYTGLASLLHYIVLSQDEPRAWLYSRGENGDFSREPEMVAGADGTLAVPGLGMTIGLADLYRGIA